ncbi:MAG: hypothetical protein JO281_13240 [Pseudonocardiales bacterium]|nr:hypothetical protein [Pseudonocardiales bacterium]
MSWYVRSVAPGDVHRGVCAHGSVRAVCGVSFFPARVSSQALLSELPEPEQVCPGCMARANGQLVVIPATCSTHYSAVISLVARRLGDGRIGLESAPMHGGCALTVDATLLFDVLGEWLG